MSENTDVKLATAQETMSVEEYIAKQPTYTTKRIWIRRFIRLVIFKLLCKVEVTGVENVPDAGSSAIMMNHISLLDPVLVMGAVTHRFVIPMTKVENLANPLLRPFVQWWGAFSVNRGEIDRKALNNSIELMKSGQLILVAPEGTRSPEGLKEPKDGLAFLTTKANAMLIPTAIMGAQDWEKKLKKFKRPHIQVNFGRPFRFKTEGRTRIPREELTQMTEEAMYQLAMAVTDPTKRGVYADLSKATTELIEFV